MAFAILRPCAAALALAVTGVAALADCGGDPGPCTIAEGTYHAVLPEGAALGTVLFLHGWGGTGEGTLTDRGMVGALTSRGYALIAPDGVPREGGKGRTWGFYPGREAPRDEMAFLTAVADDAARRFGLDRSRMILAGFSIGGSMATYTACARPGLFSAYAPVAGSFWRPEPEACAGPVRLFHTHGWKDDVVPLEGRSVGSGTMTQGDVFKSLAILRRANGCPGDDPDRRWTDGAFMLRGWAYCDEGSYLLLALHPGGHSVPKGWAGLMLDWYETVLTPHAPGN